MDDGHHFSALIPNLLSEMFVTIRCVCPGGAAPSPAGARAAAAAPAAACARAAAGVPLRRGSQHPSGPEAPAAPLRLRLLSHLSI